ncbi:hypothetical protein UFOVP6_42 [uncultured Caudovirales phage]|uniref:Uncharacterized protein n=1 Tax=uncultured Caudovirales phage TaxID=2100421 RepID=A0A6J5KJA4_9CAUD|nr:hypothetical protein UFOVP6_42 [uncultured Caudovirales phage]
MTKHNETDQGFQIDSAEGLVCNQGVGGSSPSVGTNKTKGFSQDPRNSPTGSPTRSEVFYLEPWGKSWRVVDVQRGWGLLDTVCQCARYDDALRILNLLRGAR